MMTSMKLKPKPTAGDRVCPLLACTEHAQGPLLTCHVNMRARACEFAWKHVILHFFKNWLQKKKCNFLKAFGPKKFPDRKDLWFVFGKRPIDFYGYSPGFLRWNSFRRLGRKIYFRIRECDLFRRPLAEIITKFGLQTGSSRMNRWWFRSAANSKRLKLTNYVAVDNVKVHPHSL